VSRFRVSFYRTFPLSAFLLRTQENLEILLFRVCCNIFSSPDINIFDGFSFTLLYLSLLPSFSFRIVRLPLLYVLAPTTVTAYATMSDPGRESKSCSTPFFHPYFRVRGRLFSFLSSSPLPDKVLKPPCCARPTLLVCGGLFCFLLHGSPSPP